MNQRENYLLQVFEKIGSPLMGAVIKAHSTSPSQEEQKEGQNPSDNPDETALIAQNAQKLAELLSCTVQVSIDIGKSMDLGVDVAQADSMRLALAALASPLIAENYQTSKQVPSENNRKQMIDSMHAVLSFSDNFLPTEDNTERLKTLKAQGYPVDANQTIIQFMEALSPTVAAISNFSFGQQETILIRDITEKLTTRAALLRETLWGSALAQQDEKHVELALLGTLSKIYAQCHTQEIDRVSEMQDAAPNIAPVWKNFETQVTMLETIASTVFDQNITNIGSSSGTIAPAAPVQDGTTPPAPPVQEPAQAPPMPPVQNEAPPADIPPAAPPAQPPASPPQDNVQNAQDNPMAAFAPKKEENSAPPAQPPTSPPPASPAQETTPAQAPPMPPPADTPPAAPPVQEPPQDSGQETPAIFQQQPQPQNEPQTPQQPPVEPPPQNEAPPVPPPQAPPAEPPPAPPQDTPPPTSEKNSDSGNPMAFFSKPNNSDNAGNNENS